MKINKEIVNRLEEHNILSSDGILCLMALYYNLTPTIIPDRLRSRVLATGILEATGDGLKWSIPLYEGTGNRSEDRKKLEQQIGSWIQEYRNLFQGLKVGAMGDRNGCLNNMVKFFIEYPEFADKDKILRATKKYIDTESMNQNYRYLQKAHYFIFKSPDGKDSKVSNLAAFCEEVEGGNELQTNIMDLN